MVVLDLGAAPGGWSQVAAERVGTSAGKGQVLALDLADIAPIPGVDVLKLDVSEPDAADRILAALNGARADVLLSDMAAPATGHRATDHLRVIGLVEAALDIAEAVLAPGGVFLAKVFQGGAGSRNRWRGSSAPSPRCTCEAEGEPAGIAGGLCARHRLSRLDTRRAPASCGGPSRQTLAR